MNNDYQYEQLFDDDGNEIKPGDEICVDGENTKAVLEDGLVTIKDIPDDGIIESIEKGDCDS